jgi:hypothetical protein
VAVRVVMTAVPTLAEVTEAPAARKSVMRW